MPVFAMDILQTDTRDCSSIVGNNTSNLQVLLGRRLLHPNHVVPAFKTFSNFQMLATVPINCFNNSRRLYLWCVVRTRKYEITRNLKKV